MKNLSPFLAIVLSTICVLSCNNEDGVNPDPSTVKIESISGVGTFSYKNNHLTSIRLNNNNQEDFTYDKGKLVGSRIYKRDTALFRDIPSGTTSIISIHEKLEKYSYLWDNGHIVAIMADSLMERTTQPGLPENISVITNALAVSYYFTEKRLDSAKFHLVIEPWRLSKVSYEYDAQGNVTKSKELYFPSPQSFPPSPILTFAETITEYSDYDNNPNPYSLLFEGTGPVLNKFASPRVSKNNARKNVIKVRTGDTWIELNNTVSYQYNNMGLPVEVNFNPDGIKPIITSIKYY